MILILEQERGSKLVSKMLVEREEKTTVENAKK